MILIYGRHICNYWKHALYGTFGYEDCTNHWFIKPTRENLRKLVHYFAKRNLARVRYSVLNGLASYGMTTKNYIVDRHRLCGELITAKGCLSEKEAMRLIKKYFD